MIIRTARRSVRARGRGRRQCPKICRDTIRPSQPATNPPTMVAPALTRRRTGRAGLQQARGLVVEAGVGGQPAQEPDGERAAHDRRPGQGKGRVHDQGDQEAAGQVDDEGAERKRRPEALRGPDRHQISRAGARRTRQTDPEQPFHPRPLLFSTARRDGPVTTRTIRPRAHSESGGIRRRPAPSPRGCRPAPCAMRRAAASSTAPLRPAGCSAQSPSNKRACVADGSRTAVCTTSSAHDEASGRGATRAISRTASARGSIIARIACSMPPTATVSSAVVAEHQAGCGRESRRLATRR